MSFSPTEQKKFDEYMTRLAGCEAGAIARSLATMMIFSSFSEDLRMKIFTEIKENTRIIRHNKRITAARKKTNRVEELLSKKRLKPAEKAEIAKLAKQLGFKGEA